MVVVRRTLEFSHWLKNLRDPHARARIIARIRRLEIGNPGDVASVGDGISEMRVHYGGGYRVYFIRRGGELVILLCGGDKQSQSGDIARAKLLARGLKD